MNYFAHIVRLINEGIFFILYKYTIEMNINLLAKKFVESKKSDYQQHGLSKLYHRTTLGEPAYYFIVKDEKLLNEEQVFWRQTIVELENFEDCYVEASVGTVEMWKKVLNFGWQEFY